MTSRLRKTPVAKTSTKPKVARGDGWINALTGIGAAARDKTLAARCVPDVISRQCAEDLYRGDDMAARAIETHPNEMMREGFELTAQDDKDEADALESMFCEMGADDALHEAMCYERAYGGAGILLGVNDGQQDQALPLDESRIQTFDWLTVLTGGLGGELIPNLYYNNPFAPKFGEPMTYRIVPEAPVSAETSAIVEVHESRLILFKGAKTSRRMMRLNNGWGDSILVRMNRVLAQFGQVWGGAGILMSDFSAAVLQVKDLADLIATDNDEAVINRARALALSISIARMAIIDSEETYERKATPLAGYPDMLEKFALRLAAAADMPISLLMGQAPAGLNATGASDIRFFYDRIAALQKKKLTPRIMRLMRLLMLAKNGPTRGREIENWSIEHNPLWQLTAVEEADRRLKIAQKDEIEIRSNMVSPAEAGVSRYGGDKYSIETTLDTTGRDAVTGALPDPPEPPPPQGGGRAF